MFARAGLITVLAVLSPSLLIAQRPDACVDGSVPTATVLVTANVTEPLLAGFRIALFRIQRNHGLAQVGVKLAMPSQRVEFGGLCAGKYKLGVRGADVGDCGYHAEKEFHLKRGSS